MPRTIILLAALIAGGRWCAHCAAQQATVGTSLSRIGHSFSEQIGVGFSGRFPGGFFRVPGPVGGNATGGFAIGGGQAQGQLRGQFSQSSRSTRTAQSGSLTVGNGQPGVLSDTVQRPFVIGVVPVVAGLPRFPTPAATSAATQSRSVLKERLDRLQAEDSTKTVAAAKPPPDTPAPTAKPAENPVAGKFARAAPSTSGLLSVAEIKAQRAAAADSRREEAARLAERARQAAGEQRFATARVYYRMAVRRGDRNQQRLWRAEWNRLPPR